MANKNNIKAEPLLVLLATAIGLFLVVRGMLQLTDIISQVPENERNLIYNCVNKASSREYRELVGGYLQFSGIIMFLLFIETVIRISTANITAIREIIKRK